MQSLKDGREEKLCSSPACLRPWASGLEYIPYPNASSPVLEQLFLDIPLPNPARFVLVQVHPPLSQLRSRQTRRTAPG